MPILNHIHTYERWKRKLYRCTHPDCTHYTEKSFLVGKRAKCYYCNSEFIITRADLRLAHPRCIQCANTKEAKERKVILNRLDELISAFSDKEETASE